MSVLVEAARRLEVLILERAGCDAVHVTLKVHARKRIRGRTAFAEMEVSPDFISHALGDAFAYAADHIKNQFDELSHA